MHFTKTHLQLPSFVPEAQNYWDDGHRSPLLRWMDLILHAWFHRYLGGTSIVLANTYASWAPDRGSGTGGLEG